MNMYDSNWLEHTRISKFQRKNAQITIPRQTVKNEEILSLRNFRDVLFLVSRIQDVNCENMTEKSARQCQYVQISLPLQSFGIINSILTSVTLTNIMSLLSLFLLNNSQGHDLEHKSWSNIQYQKCVTILFSSQTMRVLVTRTLSVATAPIQCGECHHVKEY